MAAARGLEVGLEFTGLSPGCDSVASAARWLRELNAANLAIGVDALHFVRTGADWAGLAGLPAGAIGYTQICDGTGLHRSGGYGAEAMDRLSPGAGDFPLARFLDALPGGIDADIEVPSPGPASDQRRRAIAAIAATRALLDQLS